MVARSGDVYSAAADDGVYVDCDGRGQVVLVDHQVGVDGTERPRQQRRAVDGVGDGLAGGHPGITGDFT